MAASAARSGCRWCGVRWLVGHECALLSSGRPDPPCRCGVARLPHVLLSWWRGAGGRDGPPARRRAGQVRPAPSARAAASDSVVRSQTAVSDGSRPSSSGPLASSNAPGRQRHRRVGEVDHAGEAAAAAEGEHPVRARSARSARRRRGRARPVGAGSPPGTAPASRPGRRSAPRPCGPSSRPAGAATGAAAPSGLNPNGGSSPDHGSGTRQPSRPGSTRAGRVPHRVLTQRVRDVLDLPEAQFLALVDVGGAGQRQRQQRGGAGPAGAQLEVGGGAVALGRRS